MQWGNQEGNEEGEKKRDKQQGKMQQRGIDNKETFDWGFGNK
jgi:hypothetical protein